MSCVEKLPHDACGSSDGLQTFFDEDKGEYTGFCFACQTYVADPYHDKPKNYKPAYYKKTPEEIQKELAELSECPLAGDIPERAIRSGCTHYFGVKNGMSETSRSDVKYRLYPYYKGDTLVGYKVRILAEKIFFTVGDVRGADLWGWKQAVEANSSRLYIMEGEEDVMAAYTTMIRKQRDGFGCSVVSLPQGSKSAIKSVGNQLQDIISRFKDIYICMDNDEAGESAKQDLLKLFPEDRKPKVVTLSGKDASDMLVGGQEERLFKELVYEAAVPLSSGIKQFKEDDWESLKAAPEMGTSTPWNGLTDIIRGFREGTTIYLGAPPKQGKSTVVNEIASHLMIEHGEPVFLIKPEESEVSTLRRVAGSVVGAVLHDPKKPYDPKLIDIAKGKIGDKLITLERSQTPKWSEVRQLIREARMLRGCKYVFLDPLSNFSVGMDSSSRNDFLHTMTRELAEDARTYGYCALIFCHFNKARDGLSWDEGRKAVADDFQGSSAMVQAADVAIAMQGWKLTEDSEHGDAEFMNKRRILHVIAEREYGSTGRVELRWNEDKGKLYEVQDYD